MKRIFGTKKEKPKAPTIEEASTKLTVRGDTCDFIWAGTASDNFLS